MDSDSDRLKQLIEQYYQTPAAFAEAVKRSPRQVRNWLNGKSKVPHWVWPIVERKQ